MTKLMVCGSRSIQDRFFVFNEINKYIEKRNLTDVVIIEGEANGVDKLAKEWAIRHNILIEPYPADWSIGKQAGILRNIEMYKAADEVLVLWDGKSKGTLHDISLCKKGDKPYEIVYN